MKLSLAEAMILGHFATGKKFVARVLKNEAACHASGFLVALELTSDEEVDD